MNSYQIMALVTNFLNTIYAILFLFIHLLKNDLVSTYYIAILLRMQVWKDRYDFHPHLAYHLIDERTTNIII